MKRVLIFLGIIMLFLTSCSVNADRTKFEENKEAQGKEALAEKIVLEMSLSEKIYQMIFATPESVVEERAVTYAGEKMKEFLQKKPVGGIILFDYNLVNDKQTKDLINSMQKYSKIPLFVGVDEEGGMVSRAGKNPDISVTHFPPMQDIGSTKDFNKAYEVGKTLGHELKTLGFNVDFAPCADILVNKDNKEIGSRAFGSDSKLTSEMVASCVRGFSEENVMTVLKHFPGHGSTTSDSHKGYSYSERTKEELNENEFLAFKSGIEAGADFVMISHATFEKATGEKTPSSLSEKIVTTWLKGEIGFEGIIITDSFSMGAVCNEYSDKEAVISAIKAGCDMILMPENIEKVHDIVSDAVKAGEIEEDRINESVKKILLKKDIIRLAEE